MNVSRDKSRHFEGKNDSIPNGRLAEPKTHDLKAGHRKHSQEYMKVVEKDFDFDIGEIEER